MHDDDYDDHDPTDPDAQATSDATLDDGREEYLRAEITEADATRLVDRLLSVDERVHRLGVQYERMRGELERERTRLREWALPLLEDYARAHPPSRGRTLRLLTGDLSFRRVPARLEVRDVERVTAWARERCPDALVERVTVHVDHRTISQHLDRTGEIPDGAQLVDERDSFAVKAPKESK
jgi:phage host-nuclease inhibitor protein Gam